MTLTVTANKVQLIDILCEDFSKKVTKLPRNTPKLVITANDPVPIEVSSGTKRTRQELRKTHEEADVVIAQRIIQLASTRMKSISVVCDDTDFFVLLVHFYHKQKLTCEVMMVSPIAGRQILDIKVTSQQQGGNSEQLLAIHAMTGCDAVSYMWGIGKAMALKQM